MFGVYTRTSVAYEPKYPDKYDPMYKKNEIDTCLKAVDLVPPKPLLNWLWKRVALLMHGTDEEAKDTLIEDLENERLRGILDANNDLGGGGMSA
jgi:hypothetical protein